MARRGFFAELQHQMRSPPANKSDSSAGSGARRRMPHTVDAEQARKAEERADAQHARASAADQKRLAKEAREAHVAAMEAEVERRNIELSQLYAAIDSLLSATLEVDDYVDLATLRTVAEHPPFDRADLETPVPSPSPIRRSTRAGLRAASSTQGPQGCLEARTTRRRSPRPPPHMRSRSLNGNPAWSGRLSPQGRSESACRDGGQARRGT